MTTATALFERMPPALRERTLDDVDRPLLGPGPFVLYWMRAAVRAHENPALDVAITAANELGLPVLVYQALAERYPFASDRHHAFALQGARDAQAELRARGIAHAFHLEREGHRGPHLRTLAKRAALVVTELVPVPPSTTWTRRLSSVTSTPVWRVDASCIVPMPLVTSRPERAFEFREATAELRAQRVGRPWPDLAPRVELPSLAELELPFEPLQLAHEDLAALIADCAIDHGVSPVAETRGGSVAGYALWRCFLERIDAYAATRDDAAVDGTSRMSAYLHHGHVAPFRLAREARAHGGAGASKFLDELLVWRELAWAWCFHTPDPHAPEAIPDWARDTLLAHAIDARLAIHSRETLCRARTGDPLWDLAQRALLRRGELHDNLRMTWGKALLGWTPDLRSAMDRLVDLNHRHALDGRDPSSYGGLWWCLGLFDRPFLPEQPVSGTVRARSTRDHLGRIDFEAVAARIDAPIAPNLPRVAVVGAGLAGLACARTLQDHGLAVSLFDKGRGVGGRMSTRRDGELLFDHGAQFFTARDERFARHVDSWCEDGVVAEWAARVSTLTRGVVGPDPRPGRRFVGTPTMNSLLRHVAADLDVAFGVKVSALGHDGDVWRVRADDGHELGAFDVVVVAVPAPQAIPLLAQAPSLARAAAVAEFAPCIAMMLAFDAPLATGFDAAFVDDSALAWIARDSSKPLRGPGERWVAHATPVWSQARLETDPALLLPDLLGTFREALGVAVPSPSSAAVHRWRFALPTRSAREASAFESGIGLGFCGDWCGGARVEAAWLSGVDVAGRVLRSLTL